LGKKFGIYLFLKNCYGPILEKKSPAIEVKNAILPIFLGANIYTKWILRTRRFKILRLPYHRCRAHRRAKKWKPPGLGRLGLKCENMY
jgi:hypothetical protein